jgi:hypothetical protein
MNTFEVIYLLIAILILVGTFFFLRFVSEKTPKGTVLGISLSTYVLGLSINPGQYAELKVIKVFFLLVGCAGIIIGVIDLWGPIGKKDQSSTQTRPQ